MARSNDGGDDRAPDLHDHGKGFASHGVDSVKAHGKGLEGHGEALKAHAFTTGHDMLFKPGAPDRHLLAHELTHPVQQ